MARKDFVFSVPSLQKDEPKITQRQKQFISQLLQTIESKNVPQATINSLGMWQASSFIDKLIDIKHGVA